jgi:hypothetical protein
MAAGAREVRAGKAFVEVALKDKTAAGLARLSRRLTAAGQAMRNVGANMMKWGAGITTPLLLAAKYAADSGSALYDMSKRTGMSVEKLSALAYAAKQTGTSLEDVEGAIRRMQKSMDANGRSPAQMFDDVVATLAKIEDPTARAAKAMEIFGKSGTNLLPMVDEFAALEARAKRLGLIVSGDTAAKMDEFGDAIEDTKLTVKRLWFEIGSSLAPVLKRAAEWFTSAAISAKGWIVRNKGLAVTLLSVGAAITIGGAALYAFGIIAKVTAVAVAGLGLALKFAWLMAGAFPAVALAGAIGLWVYIILGATGALEGLGRAFAKIGEAAQIAFQSIGDALAAGDIALAAKILWVSIKIAFAQGWAAILDQFVTGSRSLGEAWNNLVTGFRAAWEMMAYSIGSTMIDTVAFIKTAWVSLKGFIDNLTSDIGDTAVILLIDAKQAAGTITEAEAYSQRAYIRRMARVDKERRIKEKAEEGTAIQDDRLAKQAARTAEYNKNMAAIAGAGQAANAGGAGNAADAELTALKAERDRLANEAKQKRIDMAVMGQLDDFFSFENQGKTAFDDEQMKNEAKARGTFNSAALSSLGIGGDEQARTAKATEKTSKLLGDLYDVVVLKGGAFV